MGTFIFIMFQGHFIIKIWIMISRGHGVTGTLLPLNIQLGAIMHKEKHDFFGQI
jgi:hypothetical protein